MPALWVSKMHPMPCLGWYFKKNPIHEELDARESVGIANLLGKRLHEWTIAGKKENISPHSRVMSRRTQSPWGPRPGHRPWSSLSPRSLPDIKQWAHLCRHHHWSPDKCSGPWHTPPRGPGARNTRSRRPRISSTPGGHEVTDKAWNIGELYLDILEVRADPARVRPLAPAQDGDHATGAGLARSREPDGRYLAGDLRQGHRSNERPACHGCFLHQYQLVAGQWPSHLPRLTDHIRDVGCN